MKTFAIKHTAPEIRTKFKHTKSRKKYMIPGVRKTKKRKRTERIIQTINTTDVFSPPSKKRKRVKRKL